MERLEKYTHEQLVGSASFRAQHLSERLAEIPIHLGRAIRGRKRPALNFIETLHERSLPTVPEPVIKALERRLSNNEQPLFDQFSRHYLIKNPTKENVSRYIEGVNRRNKKWSDDPEVRRQLRQSKQRQIMYAGDRLQKTVLTDYNIARYREAALQATYRQIANNEAPDKELMIISAGAIEDFGFCLMDSSNVPLIEDFRFFPLQNKSGGDELNGSMIGAYLAHLGQRAVDEPQILTQNRALLQLVAFEQQKREAYWGRIYETSREVLGNRLSQQDVDDMEWVDDTVKQFNAV